MNNYFYNGSLGSHYWINSYNKDFDQIQKESNLPFHFREMYKSETLIKPVNKYAFYYSPFPDILIDNNVILRQKTHAEIWVEPKTNGLYALDKTWQRQFYPSSTQHEDPECFAAVYKFYTPWIINENIVVKINNIENSPFKIITNSIIFEKNDNFTSPQWIDFLIKKEGNHMKTLEYGIIELGTPAFDIIINNDLLIEKIKKEFYGQSYKIYSNR